MHFLKCLLVLIFLVWKLITDNLGPEFRLRALEPYFCLLDPQSIFFLTSCKILDRWIYHTTILILGSGGLFASFWPPKVYIFLLHVKFLIDGYITRPYWFWAPNSVFGLWGPIIAFLTPKIMFFLAPLKIPDRWIYHTTILILGPKFRFWALEAYYSLFDPQNYIFSCST
jgi:hypothetical protein